MGACAVREEVDLFENARVSFEGLVTRLKGRQALGMKHNELEAMVGSQGQDVLQQLLQDHLKLRALTEEKQASVVGADGVERTHVRDRSRTLMTLLGPVNVERKGYSARGTESVFPMDAELNLPVESFSLGVRRRVATEVVRGSYDDVVESIQATTAARVSKRQVEQLAVRAAVDFDAFYALRQQEAAGAPPPSPAGPPLLVLTTDGKGVVMRKDALREATREAADAAQPPMKKRVASGQKANRKRMAQVASVYEVAPFMRRPIDIVHDLRPVPDDKRPAPPKPVNKRVWASLEKTSEEVIAEMFAEAHSRDPEHRRRWVVLVDGSGPQLEAIKRQASRLGVSITIIMDVIHVIEYLWQAGMCLMPAGTADLERWVNEHLLDVLSGKAAVVGAAIRRSATARKLSKKARKAADKCADYLQNHAEYLRYADALSDGLPIATGVIEGTCRHLIKDRMDITGARWGLTGAESVLRLRALKQSGDFEDYWNFHVEQEEVRNHLAATSANTKSNQPPALRLIHGGASS